MKVWVVTYQDWDTEGNSSPPLVVGVFSSEDKIPERFKERQSYASYDTHEIEVDKAEAWRL